MFVSDRVAIDPEAVNSYFMNGTLFNVELFRTHVKRSAGNPDHVRGRRITRTAYRGPFTDHRRPLPTGLQRFRTMKQQHRNDPNPQLSIRWHTKIASEASHCFLVNFPAAFQSA